MKYPRYFLVDCDKIAWIRENPVITVIDKKDHVYEIICNNVKTYWSEDAFKSWEDNKWCREIPECEVALL